jgi:hypothetical protein
MTLLAIHLNLYVQANVEKRSTTGTTLGGYAMKKCLVMTALIGALTLGVAAPALADPTGSTGPPSQSCQSYSASTRPGNSAFSPGAPFNEQGINSIPGGTGGANYSPKSQYDVACFEWNAHHS